jgi:hypothetical protein
MVVETWLFFITLHLYYITLIIHYIYITLHLAKNSTKEIFTSTRTTYMPPYTIDKLMSGMTYSVWLKAVSTTGVILM